jgi:hypothetical protein
VADSGPKGDRRAQQLKPSRAANPERRAARQAEIEAASRGARHEGPARGDPDIEGHDLLAAAFARLLLWTYPHPRPATEATA